MDAMKIITEGMIKEDRPEFNVGDTVRVSVRIKEGERERIPVSYTHLDVYKRQEQLYPTAKVKPEPFTVPQVNSGEEHVLFVQVLLCALLVVFVFFARSAGAPFLEDMRAEYHEMMTAGVEFSTDNAFARFANGVVEDPVSYTHLDVYKRQVRDLFYNTPARMKFLKKDTSEGNYVADVVTQLALSHPEVSFKFVRDGKPQFQTPGDGKLLGAAYAVLSRDFAKDLVPVEHTVGSYTVRGLVTPPKNARASRAMQYFFINGRFVKNRTMMAALEAAYKGVMMQGKFPG